MHRRVRPICSKPIWTNKGILVSNHSYCMLRPGLSFMYIQSHTYIYVMHTFLKTEQHITSVMPLKFIQV